MPHHVHLLLTPPSEILEPTLTPSLGDCKEAVVRSVRAINRRLKRIWRRGGGSDRTNFSCGEFREKRLYIHRNAVRAGPRAKPRPPSIFGNRDFGALPVNYVQVH